MAAASLVVWMTGAAGALGCQNLRVADIRFCSGGTSWQNVRPVPEEVNGVVTVMAGRANRRSDFGTLTGDHRKLHIDAMRALAK